MLIKSHYNIIMKISVNAPCPCHSGNKYKKCCQPYHKGVLPPNSMLLMRSRYCAFALRHSHYIIATTHSDNIDFTPHTTEWLDSIDAFAAHTEFLGLEILEFIDGRSESFVKFKATLNSGVLSEKSRFLKHDGRWLYVDGEFE
jgi:SEC-C motif-containing protein